MCVCVSDVGLCVLAALFDFGRACALPWRLPSQTRTTSRGGSTVVAHPSPGHTPDPRPSPPAHGQLRPHEWTQWMSQGEARSTAPPSTSILPSIKCARGSPAHPACASKYSLGRPPPCRGRSRAVDWIDRFALVRRGGVDYTQSPGRGEGGGGRCQRTGEPVSRKGADSLPACSCQTPNTTKQNKTAGNEHKQTRRSQILIKDEAGEGGVKSKLGLA